MLLKDSKGSTAAGVTMDFTASNKIGTQKLISGAKLFNSYLSGSETIPNIVIKGLKITNSYDLIIYSDWWWGGDAYPVTQTQGTGLNGKIFLNRIPRTTKGVAPDLAEDTNPADVESGTGNLGNWFRIKGLSPTLKGELGFRLGERANAPFNGFQLILTGAVPPRADILSMDLPNGTTTIDGTNVTLNLPYGTNVTDLAPNFTLWPGVKCIPPSGTKRNFTTPQTYKATSSDSRVVKNYTVTAVIAPPLPEFILTAPASWDGRTAVNVQPDIKNLALLQAKGGTQFTYQWSLNGVAVGWRITPGLLTLTRSQGSGPLVVSLTMANGTSGVTRSVAINVQDPANEPWLERTPDADEKPVNGQFFARNPVTNLGTIFYRGTQGGTADAVYLKIFKTPDGGAETLDATLRQPLVKGAYAFSAPITPGLITCRLVYGTTTGGVDTDVATVTDLVCGDAYIIEGQSNAVATDNSADRDDTSSPWIRTYGRAGGGWNYARNKASQPLWEMNVGFWGMALARKMVTDHHLPVCFINGAVGGTLISQHQANPLDPTVADGKYEIYANLLNRVIAAKLTHGIRGVFWHQGESDCSYGGPGNEFEYTAYEQNFVNMTAAWKQSYPNIQRYMIYQVMPKPCGISPKGDQLREVQRNLPRLYSKMSILNTLGIDGYEGCHFSRKGYENMAERMAPLVSQDFYGIMPDVALSAPNLKRAYFATNARTAVVLEFDQAMTWNNFSLPNFYVDDVAGKVTSGTASGNLITLQLSDAAAKNAKLDYLNDSFWEPTQPCKSA